MAETVSMALAELIRKAEEQGDVDFLREGVRVLAQAVMEAEVTELTGAAKTKPSATGFARPAHSWRPIPISAFGWPGRCPLASPTCAGSEPAGAAMHLECDAPDPAAEIQHSVSRCWIEVGQKRLEVAARP